MPSRSVRGGKRMLGGGWVREKERKIKRRKKKNERNVLTNETRKRRMKTE